MTTLLLFSIAVASSPFGIAKSIRHFDIDTEAENIDEQYHLPMIGIYRMLKIIMIHCNRLPLENEFKDFVLNGRHRNIKCTELIKTWTSDRGEIAVGKKIPNLRDFLEKNNFRVFSDSKKIIISSHHNSKLWNFKYIPGHKADMVIRCTYANATCEIAWLKQHINNCRRDKIFAKNNCFFSGKKIIDY